MSLPAVSRSSPQRHPLNRRDAWPDFGSHAVALTRFVSRILSTRLIVAGLAIALHAWLPAARAAIIYNEHPLSRAIDQLAAPAPGSNGQRFTVPVNSSAAMDYDSGHNTLSWFDAPPQNVNWQSASTYDQSFEHFAFRSADTTRRNAFISASDGQGNMTDAFTATISVKEFTLDNVNLDPRGNLIALTGASHVWTMNNSSYNGELATPSFTATYPLTFTATGSSSLDNWSGPIPSRTDLFVPGGSTFTILRSGDIASSLVVNSLRFESTAGNTADIDGSTLSIDHSFVTFVTGATPAVTGGVVTAGMVVRNNGTLNISGSDGTDSYADLHVEGGLLVDGSTLQVANRGHLTVTEKLVLNNAAVNFVDNLRDSAIIAEIAQFQGTTTITANNPAGYTTSGFSGGFFLANSSTVVNIAGLGPTFADGLFDLGGGTVNVAADASLVIRSSHTEASSPTGSVNIASAGALEIGNNFTLHTRDLNLHNEGTISVYGHLIGGSTLTGSGDVVLDGESSLMAVAADQSSFTIDGDLSFLKDSWLRLMIDPSLRTSQHISVADLHIFTPFNIPTTNLQLRVENDALLSFGTKFLLVDYDTLTAGEHFKGFADGSIFKNGLNWYQIHYYDPYYDNLNPTVITLTAVQNPAAVPEPSTWILCMAGIAGCCFTRRWRFAARKVAKS
jgi:hypothetical protein